MVSSDRDTRFVQVVHAVHGVPGLIEFGIEALPDGQDTLLRVSGEVDIATAPLLDMAAHSALAGRPGQVHLHLGEVTFFDCAGLAILIELRNAELLAPLVAVSRPVRRLMELAGVTHLFGLGGPTPRRRPA